jgi:hypothetical protein
MSRDMNRGDTSGQTSWFGTEASSVCRRKRGAKIDHRLLETAAWISMRPCCFHARAVRPGRVERAVAYLCRVPFVKGGA